VSQNTGWLNLESYSVKALHCTFWIVSSVSAVFTWRTWTSVPLGLLNSCVWLGLLLGLCPAPHPQVSQADFLQHWLLGTVALTLPLSSVSLFSNLAVVGFSDSGPHVARQVLYHFSHTKLFLALIIFQIVSCVFCLVPSSSLTCTAGTTDTSHHVWPIDRHGGLFGRLALNRTPSELHLLSGWDYRYVPLWWPLCQGLKASLSHASCPSCWQKPTGRVFSEIQRKAWHNCGVHVHVLRTMWVNPDFMLDRTRDGKE
jgi:hypothetical protein